MGKTIEPGCVYALAGVTNMIIRVIRKESHNGNTYARFVIIGVDGREQADANGFTFAARIILQDGSGTEIGVFSTAAGEAMISPLYELEDVHKIA